LIHHIHMSQRPRIHILWEFSDKPWGGGNQFLKALKTQFVAQGLNAETPETADVILFNSHQFQKQALQLKRKYPQKVFIHRVDGPLFHTRGDSGIATDRAIFYCNRLIADGTVFQSKWSRNESYRQGMGKNRHETCIINAPDPMIFHATQDRHQRADNKIRLIATTWSSNPRKGFDIFNYLDDHLDFSTYSMTFVGNTETSFRNINAISPQPSEKLADLLRGHDIFIAASQGEPCSNSFLEALHCGLPAVARNNSSYPELLNGNGLLFNGTEDVLQTIGNIARHIDAYRANINVLSMTEVATLYIDFITAIYRRVAERTYATKRLSPLSYLHARLLLKYLRKA